ncbi:MAG TPA: Ig-like domain-containing protein [Vicinamibacterales bacterium]|nr:Ig-like domain-containing protein [Vicinamibacterales bacterium]
MFTISGAGQGIGGTSDQFMFVYQKLTGDGTVKLRLLSLAGTSTMEAGLMMRESLAATARHASILAGATAFTVRSRAATSGATSSVAVARGGWLRLERVGPVITASVSSDGAQWTLVTTQTLTLPATIYVGIAVSSRASTATATATVSSMSVTATTPTMPAGWASSDVGVAPSPGTASYSANSFIAASHGAGLSGAADAFRFIYTRTRGDAKLTARVAASQGRPGRQAGVVLRTALDAGAPAVAVLADESGLLFVARGGPGQAALQKRISTNVAPVFVQLDRKGSMVTVAHSLNGTTWSTAATIGVPFGTDLYAGMAVAAGPNGGPAAAAFDKLSLVSVAANVPPVVSLTSPKGGQSFTVGTSIPLTAIASDPDDLVARVDFLVNGVKVASDTAAPYAAAWTAAAAGSYSVKATAFDFDGAATTSTAASITVGSVTAPPTTSTGTGTWRLEFGASVDHAKLDYYQVEIYGPNLPLPLIRNIGKPALDASRNCRVDLNSVITALPLGQYSVIVRAVAGGWSSPSSPYSFAR